MKPRHTIQAVIRSGDESGYVAECVDFPVVSQGATVEESLSNLRGRGVDAGR
ncbi:MAG: type II toxin-antitoxin system HicB family antitoxin [Firmicutes bacterium]|nr:type II toxin-antitoxin system HicB family antitoxin [Bacillota bacterium]